jgi:hypothetical protein
MTPFNPRRLRFGAPAEADQGNDLPTPALVRSRARRALGIAEAAGLLAHLPGPGESLHVCTSRSTCPTCSTTCSNAGPRAA